MKRHLFTLLKVALVATLMWFVFRSINFDDRIEYRIGDEVVAERVVEIQGHWNENPVAFRIAGDEAVQRIEQGAVDAQGRTQNVVPGFLSYWTHMDPLLFAVGCLLYVLTVLIAGTRWWWLLRVNGTDVSLPETLRFTWIGVFFNSVVPGATGGDVVKALYIMKRCPGHRVQVLVSVGVDRILGLGSLALLGAIMVLFALDRYGEIALGIWGVIVGVALLGLVAFSRRLRELVRLKPLLNKLPGRLRSVLHLVDQAVFFYRDQRFVIAASLIAGMFNHVLSVGCVLCLGEAIGVGMPPFEYFVLVPVINIISAVPIGPNGLGVGEWLYGNLYAHYGAHYLQGAVADPALAMKTRGVALSLLYRLVLTFFSGLGGLFLLFEQDRVTREDVDREVALEEQESEQRQTDDDPASA